MRPRSRFALPLLLALALVVAGAPPAQAKSLAGLKEGALDWVEARALAGAGSFAPHFTQAVEANGIATTSWPAADPLADQVTIPGPGAAAIQLLRPLHALALAGDPRASLDSDLAQRVLASFDGTQFGSAQALNDDAYAILALAQAGLPTTDDRLQASGQALAAAQNADGGWGWALGSTSGTDMTGLVLDALHLVDRLEAAAKDRALAFVATTRGGTGYAETPGGTPNCESTAWALRARAHDDRATDPGAWRMLVSLQNADGGFAHVTGGPSDPFCTAEVLMVVALAEAGTLEFTVAEKRGIPAVGFGWIALALSTTAVAVSTRVRHD